MCLTAHRAALSVEGVVTSILQTNEKRINTEQNGIEGPRPTAPGKADLEPV